MKHLNTHKPWAAFMLMLLTALLAVPIGTTAQNAVGFQEDFNYPAGDLFGNGGWMHDTNKQTANPIQVVDKALVYPGYTDKADGKSVKLGKLKSSEKLQKRFDQSDEGVLSGNVYYSALINVEEQPTGNCYPMALTLRTKASVVAEGKSGVDLGRLYLSKGDNADEVKIGIERGATKPVFAATPLKLNQTYLVVVRYQVQPNAEYQGQGLDNVYLYVNPESFTAEPSTPSAVIDGVNFTGSGVKSYGLQGLALRQSTTSSVTAPVMYIGSVRVADTYAGLFGTTGEDKTPVFSVSDKSLVLGNVYTGDEYTKTVTVTGENLTGDITVESSSAAVAVEPATLSAADVMSSQGAKLNIKVNYTEGEQFATVTLKSDGAEDKQIKISWTGYTIPEIKTIKALYSEDPEAGLSYRYTGEAVITFIDKGAAKPAYYLQDATGAISLTDEWEVLTTTDYNVGDKLTGTILGIQSSFGTLSAVAYNTNLGKVLSSGNAVTPVEATLTQLKETPNDYIQQVVAVKNLKFKDVAEGATFTEGMVQPVVTDGTEEAKVRIFKGTSLIGKNIPSGDVTLTGLFTSKAMIIGPRGIEDIQEQQPQGEPSITFTPEKIEQKAGTLGKTVEVATVHVSAKNMTSATTFELAGKNAD